MGDRFLSRGKRIDNGEWVEGYLSYPFCTKKGNESYYFYAKDSLGFFCRCVVDASTICQCTGLKPCPFCGGKAMFLTITNKSSHSAVGVMFKIKCMKCGTELPKSYECEMYMDQDGGIRTGKDERTKATTDWNRRASDGKTD